MSEEKETQSKDPSLASSSNTAEANHECEANPPSSSLAKGEDEMTPQNSTTVPPPGTEDFPISKTPTPGIPVAHDHELETASDYRGDDTKANSKSTPHKNSSKGRPANHTSGKNGASSNVMNHTFATPLSPMHPHPMQHAYYYPTHNIPHSPATPSMNNSGYDPIVGTSLAQNNVSNMFLRQHYPIIPPLSPPSQPASDANNSTKGQYATGGQYGDESNFNSSINHNLSMGAIPPASPLFPGAVPIFGGSSEQMIPMDSNAALNGRSMMGVGLTPNSPSLQYLGAPPPSPVISYGGMYTSSGLQGSPEHSWSER
jgi:hypothetical protein